MISYYKNLFNINKKYPLSINILNILFYILPFSFILGNLVLNLNVAIFIIVGSIYYKKKIFFIKQDLFLKLLLLFFLYLIFTTVINFLDTYYSENSSVNDIDNHITNVLKSIAFLRFFLLVLILKTMLTNKDLFLKPFFFISLFLCLFISSDLIFQEIFGYNFFGMEPSNLHKRSGIFGEELIAGTYLFRFGVLGIFSYLIFYPKDNLKKLNLKNILIMSLIFIGLILTTNRMPLISFMFLFFISIFTFVDNKKFYYKIFILFLTIFLIFFFSHHRTNHNFKNVVLKAFTIIEYKFVDLSGIKKNVSNEEDLSSLSLTKKDKSKKGWHINIYYTSYTIWKSHPFLGGGMKSFRHDCFKINPNVSYADKISCGNHSHNYYLEILTELGAIGLLIFLSLLLILFKDFNYRKKKGDNEDIFISFLFLLIFIIELFPLKSTGSFFTTGNATYIFIVLGILLGNRLKKKRQRN